MIVSKDLRGARMIVALLLIKVHCRLRLWDKFCVSEEASGLIGSETACRLR